MTNSAHPAPGADETGTFTLRLPEPLKRHVRIYAAQRGESAGAVARALLADGLRAAGVDVDRDPRLAA